jgi:hypothetical protein
LFFDFSHLIDIFRHFYVGPGTTLFEIVLELTSKILAYKFACAVASLNLKEEQQALQASHLGDLYVYGVLRGLEGLAVHDDVMAHYDKIPKWYHHMQHIVEPSK